MSFKGSVALLAMFLAFGVAHASPAGAAFGISTFSGEVNDQAGNPYTQAAGHPYVASSTIMLNSHTGPLGLVVPDADVKNLSVELPSGFVGNPLAVPRCRERDLQDPDRYLDCRSATQVGVSTLYLATSIYTTPVFNMVPPRGMPAQFAFNLAGVVVHLDARLRRDGTYGVSVDSKAISQANPFYGTTVELWGVPASPAHDSQRGFACITGDATGAQCASQTPEVAFLTNPSDCEVGPLTTTLRATPWSEPGTQYVESFDHDPSGDPLEVGNCEGVPFDPKVAMKPTSSTAGAPSGLDLELSVPVEGLLSPKGISQSPVKDVSVTFPRGVSVNASAAEGLVGCDPAAIALDSERDPACPPASKIGTVRVDTPLVDHPLPGAVYLATQGSNPFNSLLALYVVIDDPQTGVVVKLPGKVTPNAETGQLTAVFEDNPQVPFERLRIQLNSGPRAPLATPNACGTYAIRTELTSWARPNEVVSSDSSFTIDQGCGKDSQFTPGFEAGATNPVGGAYSPFTLRVTREDGQQNISRIDATLPEGLLAKLAGVPLCGDAGANSGNCPQASQVGTTTVGVGAGSNPLYVPQAGKAPTAAYLAGPYKGAPYSLVVKVPAQAGPFDLGTVAVRSAISVDPTNAQVSVKSDPLPQILQGIPIAYRDVRVDVNRSNFTLNPTSCDPMTVNAVIASAQGKSANVSDRFQVGSCERLGFTPKLTLSLKGATRRAAYPALKAVLKAKPGQANIGKVSVALPGSEFLAQNHIRTVCTRVQFAAEACPPGSVYGYATATTPLLDKPLSGPVYLRSSSNPLPDLVAALDGQIDIDLVGRIDSVDGGIRTTFDQVPDAPVSKFVLSMKGGKKGLLVNSRNLCNSTNKAKVLIDGQNGKTADQSPVLTNSCGKKAKKRR